MVHKLYLLSANLLLLLALAILCPYLPNVYAETSLVARTTETSSVSIALAPSIDLELLPTATGTVSYKATDLTITTNRSSGFRVLVSSNSNTLNNKHHSEAIPSINTSTSLNNLPTNSFGVYLGASNPNNNSIFSPLNTTPTEFANNDLANASGTYKLAVGAKVDTSLPAGLYSNTITVSVIAKAPEITSLSDATYMQDVTPEICANSKIWESEADSAALIDKRDGKLYKVARLKDGNCWMQENLALTLSTNTPLTSEDSDIATNGYASNNSWVPTLDTSMVVTDNRDSNGQASWSINGNWYYQWNAAVAGSGEELVNADATSSICPKGWELPASSGGSSAPAALISAYGIYANDDFLKAPIYFVRTGMIVNGSLAYSGNNGGLYCWLNRAATVGESYYFGLFIEYVPSYPTQRQYGITVRCMAK